MTNLPISHTYSQNYGRSTPKPKPEKAKTGSPMRLRKCLLCGAELWTTKEWNDHIKAKHGRGTDA